jgi:hypothetical protein
VPTLNEERIKYILLEEAYRTIRLNEGNAQVTIPMAQAVIRSLAVNAAEPSAAGRARASGAGSSCD